MAQSRPSEANQVSSSFYIQYNGTSPYNVTKK